MTSGNTARRFISRSATPSPPGSSPSRTCSRRPRRRSLPSRWPRSTVSRTSWPGAPNERRGIRPTSGRCTITCCAAGTDQGGGSGTPASGGFSLLVRQHPVPGDWARRRHRRRSSSRRGGRVHRREASFRRPTAIRVRLPGGAQFRTPDHPRRGDGQRCDDCDAPATVTAHRLHASSRRPVRTHPERSN